MLGKLRHIDCGTATPHNSIFRHSGKNQNPVIADDDSGSSPE
jgi:hypothetical protein